MFFNPSSNDLVLMSSVHWLIFFWTLLVGYQCLLQKLSPNPRNDSDYTPGGISFVHVHLSWMAILIGWLKQGSTDICFRACCSFSILVLLVCNESISWQLRVALLLDYLRCFSGVFPILPYEWVQMQHQMFWDCVKCGILAVFLVN